MRSDMPRSPSSLLLGLRRGALLLRGRADPLQPAGPPIHPCPRGLGPAPPPPLLPPAPAAARFAASSSAAAAPAAQRRAAASAAGAVATVPREVAQFWADVVERQVDRPAARRLLPHVDVTRPLGLPAAAAPPANGASSSSAAHTQPRAVPLYSFYADVKRLHPTKVVLVRVGEFYEAVGLDAVLLVQHAGLNPMGSGSPPRAGCPRRNLRRAVADLVRGGGLSVVVCEESPEPYNYGARRQRQKTRYVAAVATPAAPLVHGLLDDDAGGDDDGGGAPGGGAGGAPPLLGVAAAVGGLAVAEVRPAERTVALTEGLTEDAVYARLHEGGLAPPLYVHAPRRGPAGAGDARLSEAAPEAAWERRVGALFRGQVGVVQRLDDADFVEGLLRRVRLDLGLPPGEPFTLIRNPPGGRPRPLYFSTASNLGLHAARGVPPLLDAALPPGAPLACRRWLRGLLLLPPPPAVAAAVAAALAELCALERAAPALPVLPPAGLVLTLREREAGAAFFRDLHQLCAAVAAACSDPALERLADALLAPVAAETGFAARRADLAAAAADAAARIAAVVEHADGVGDWSDDEARGGDSSSAVAAFSDGDEPFGAAEGGDASSPVRGAAALARLFADCEAPYRGRVRPERLGGAAEAAATARRRVEAELGAAAAALAAALGGGGRAPAALLSYDAANAAVWLKVPRAGAGGGAPAAAAAAAAKAAGLSHPRDRNGRLETGAYSSPAVEAALDDYRRACAAAADAVRAALRALAGDLAPAAPQLVAAATFGVVAGALDAHAREARRRGWAAPRLLYGPGVAGAGAAGPAPPERQPALEFEGLWPYWLDGDAGSTAKNSLRLAPGLLLLLTGPNMAGKSTLLRAAAAAALLGACGLRAPVASASLPYVDAFMLRNFSADAPAEGKSSFAVEMTEVRYLLDDATPQSLVLVDELGKGTEAAAGAALARALLEELGARRCAGVFATHLHALLDPAPVPVPGAGGGARPANPPLHVSMETVDAGGGRRRPTWRLVEGGSRESLALQVAADAGLPAALLARAAQLYAAAPPAPPAAGAQAGGRKGEAAAAAPPPPAPAAAGPPPARSLEEAAAVLLAAARAAAAAAGAPPPPRAAGLVRAGERPPPRLVGAPCVYVARRPDGWFYCGSSGDLDARLAAHRGRAGRAASRVADPRAELAYVEVAGAGGARAAEAHAIAALAAAGFPMLSTADAAHRGAPRGGGAGAGG